MTPVSPDDFKKEVWVWATRICVDPAEIHLRKMKSKWGSCSTTGRLTFNTDLLDEAQDVRERAIVHELLHLKIPNHGSLFRNLERAYLNQRHQPKTRSLAD